MKRAHGFYFDGRRARRHEVDILLGGDRVKVVGADVAADYDARRVRVSPRIARTPRWMYLPDGGTCVIDDGELLNRKALALGAGGSTIDERTAIAQAPSNVASVRPNLGSSAKARRAQVVDLLTRGDYEELNRTLEALQAAFEQDPATSVDLEVAFAAFGKVRPELGPKVDEWASRFRNSYPAAVARGNYYLARGKEARGTKFSAETPESAMNQMRDHFPGRERRPRAIARAD